MTETLDVFNFKHCVKQPRKVVFGPYVFDIQSRHLDESNFANNETHHFNSKLENDKLLHITSRTPASRGDWVSTATLEFQSALSDRSTLFPDTPFLTGADDLALILSFLTGRHVRVGNDGVKPFLPVLPGESLLSGNYFYSPIVDWSNFSNLRAAGGSEAMRCVCLAMTSSDVLIMMSMGSTALDILVNKWHSAEKTSRFTKDVRAKLDAAKVVFESHLNDAGMEADLVRDVVSRLNNIASESAFLKLQAFLVRFGMFPSHAEQVIVDQLKRFNSQRNLVVHSGKVKLDVAATVDASVRVAGVIAKLVLTISRVYVAKHLLMIDDEFGVEKARQSVLAFFLNGTFNGQKVFEEDFDVFMQRLELHWQQKGELPDWD